MPTFLDERKKAKLQWVQDPSQRNVDNLHNVRREASIYFRNKNKAVTRKTSNTRFTECNLPGETAGFMVPIKGHEVTTPNYDKHIPSITWAQNAMKCWK